jgi:hypothetical protein
VSFLLSTYNNNINNIGVGKKYATKMQLWTYVAAQLNANFKSNKTPSNVAKKFQNITKVKCTLSFCGPFFYFDTVGPFQPKSVVALGVQRRPPSC